MNAADIVAATTIASVWVALGGDAPKRGRARAFWREGDNPHAVSLSDAKSAWFDHRDGKGGGVLDLVQHIRGCDRGSAVRWLADFAGVPLNDRPMTLAGRRQYARAAADVDALAQRLADFAHGLGLVAEKRLARLSAALVACGIDPTETLAQMHRQAHLLRIATPRDIAQLWQAMPKERQAVEHMRRGDREHAEAVTRAIVEMLARLQERSAA